MLTVINSVLIFYHEHPIEGKFQLKVLGKEFEEEPFFKRGLCEKISVKSKTVIKNDIWERLE